MIRAAGPADVAQVASLLVELKNHHHPLQPDSPRYLVADDRWWSEARDAIGSELTHVFVATVGSEVCGLVILHFAPKPWGRSCEVETLVVAERWRGRGLGQRLMSWAEDFASRHGARGMRVEVLDNNSSGRSFYEDLGYQPTAVRYAKPIGG